MTRDMAASKVDMAAAMDGRFPRADLLLADLPGSKRMKSADVHMLWHACACTDESQDLATENI